MNKKSKFVFYTFVLLGTILIFQISYLYNTKTITLSELKLKNSFTKLVGLPDLAISTEASYVRHRSLSNMGDIFKDDGSLREYFVSTYAFSSSGLINKKSLDEK